jgi:putative flippase GtrA
VGAAIKTGLTVVGSVVSVVAGLAGGGGAAASGGAAAAGGGAAATTGAGGTAAGGGAAATSGGAAAGGGGATTGGSVLAGGGGGTLAGSALETVALGVSAGGAGATAVIVGIIVAYIIADRVTKAQELDKDWQGYAGGLNINALALNRIETDVSRAWLAARGLSWTETSVRDFRLDRRFAGQKLQSIGYRTVLSTFGQTSRGIATPLNRSSLRGSLDVISAPPPEPEWRHIRAIAMEALRLRSMYGYRLIKAWNIITPPANWGMTADLLRSEYESALPGVGSLADLPHAVGGATVEPRSDPSQAFPPPMELVGNGVENAWDPSLVTDEDRKAANLMALVDALAILRWDPRTGIDDDPAFYARAVCDALQWGGNTVDGLELRGEWLWLNPALFPVPKGSLPGEAVQISPDRLRRGQPYGVTVA